MQHQEKIQFFSYDEARTMLAVVDRILPQEDRLPERRIPILPSLDHRLFLGKINGYRYEDMPPDGEAYRIGVRAFELIAQRLHGCRFDELPTLEQEKLLRSIHQSGPAGGARGVGQDERGAVLDAVGRRCVFDLLRAPVGLG